MYYTIKLRNRSINPGWMPTHRSKSAGSSRSASINFGSQSGERRFNRAPGLRRSRGERELEWGKRERSSYLDLTSQRPSWSSLDHREPILELWILDVRRSRPWANAQLSPPQGPACSILSRVRSHVYNYVQLRVFNYRVVTVKQTEPQRSYYIEIVSIGYFISRALSQASFNLFVGRSMAARAPGLLTPRSFQTATRRCSTNFGSLSWLTIQDCNWTRPMFSDEIKTLVLF